MRIADLRPVSETQVRFLFAESFLFGETHMDRRPARYEVGARIVKYGES